MSDLKFKQIASSVTMNDQGHSISELFGLTEDGIVYTWVEDSPVYTAGWTEMTMELSEEKEESK